MALLQIAEPGESKPVETTRRVAVGIDLGTTNSLVAWIDPEGNPVTLEDEQGAQIIPSAVHIDNNGAIMVGNKAREKATQDPAHTFLSIKRIMGKSAADISEYQSHYPYDFIGSQEDVPRIRIADKLLTAVELSAEILKYLSKVAATQTGDEPEGVVITVPAYFDDGQRQATKDAARLAGLKVLRLLNEPTAAAVAYGLDQDAEGIHAIFDLGGGTFDISILHLNRGVFEVLATNGDTALGGDDFDMLIVHWITSKMGFGSACSEVFSCQLRQLARQARERLTLEESVDIDVKCSCGERWQGALTREIFNGLADKLIDRALRTCRRAMSDAGLRSDQIREVVMVGGATRMPRVRERVGEFFDCDVLVDIDPDRVVAIGAAIQADQLVGNRRGDELLLLDVLPLSLGLETMGGLVERIIPRNSTIPVTRAQEFTTFRDGQTAMAIHVLQGERDLVTDCRSLARFELRGIPPMVAGAARIRVTFQVDADGILSVFAQEMTTGIESHVEVKPSYGLSDSEVEDMLKDSFEFAQDDVKTRRLVEQQVEADRILEALLAALHEDGDQLLDKQEREQIEQSAHNLKAARTEGTVEQIEDAISSLEQACSEYVMRRMNATVQKAMTGSRIDEFE